MDGDFRVDTGEIHRSIESAEVIALYFPLLRKTLLVDTRSSALDRPLVRVVPMAESVEARFRSLRRLRPRFPQPESIAIVPWDKYVPSLKRLGVLDCLLERIAASGCGEAVRSCNEAYEELMRLQQDEFVKAIKGIDYTPIWGKVC